MSMHSLNQFRRRCAQALMDGVFDGCPHCRMRPECNRRAQALRALALDKDFKRLLTRMSAQVGFNGLLQTLALEYDSPPGSAPELLSAVLMHMLGASPALANLSPPQQPWMQWLESLYGLPLARVEQEALDCLSVLRTEVEGRHNSPDNERQG